MYLEAKETARLYKLLTEKLGSDTTEAMFKYIDNKTERSVEATIKTLATKDDIANLRKEVSEEFANFRKEVSEEFANFRKEVSEEFGNFRKEVSEEFGKLRTELAENTIKIHKEMGFNKADNIKWMFIFWVGQVGATLAILLLFIKK